MAPQFPDSKNCFPFCVSGLPQPPPFRLSPSFHPSLTAAICEFFGDEWCPFRLVPPLLNAGRLLYVGCGTCSFYCAGGRYVRRNSLPLFFTRRALSFLSFLAFAPPKTGALAGRAVSREGFYGPRLLFRSFAPLFSHMPLANTRSIRPFPHWQRGWRPLPLSFGPFLSIACDQILLEEREGFLE